MANENDSVLLRMLRHCHAAETQAEQILQRQMELAADLPELQARLKLHREETRDQRLRLETLLDERHGARDTWKGVLMRVSGNLAAWRNVAAEHSELKNIFDTYAFEHLEIATYRTIIHLAEKEGDTAVAEKCRESLREEEAMATWFNDHLTSLVDKHLERYGDATEI